MIVIKQFYRHSDKKTYLVGDKYEGEKFEGIEDYIKEDKKTKVVKKRVVKTK